MKAVTSLAASIVVLSCAGAVCGQDLRTPPTRVLEQRTHTVTPEDVLSLRELSEVRLSPDGRQIAFVVSEPSLASKPRESRASNVWIIPADGREAPRPLIPGLKSARAPSWSSDGRTLAFLSVADFAAKNADGSEQIYLLRMGEKRPVRLTNMPGGVEQFQWSPDGRMIAFTAEETASPKERERRSAGDDAVVVDRNFTPARLWIVSLSDRKTVQLTKQDFEISEFRWSPSGDEFAVVVARSAKPEDSLLLSLVVVNRSSGEVARTLSGNASPIRGLLRWSPDGRWITFLEGPPTKEFGSWTSVVAAGGGPVRPVMKDFRGSVMALEWMADSRHWMAQVAEGTRQALAEVDSADGTMRRLTDVAQSQWNYGFSTDGSTMAYFAQTSDSPTDLWVLRTGAIPRRITEFNPQTRFWRLGQVREIEWKNSKDAAIRRGVLITPPDYRPDRTYPTVVNTHPGDTPWWNGFHASKWWDWGQLLASNGYVVFLPNTRGVNGEGWRLHQTTADWGGMAYQDLADGVDHLVAQKIADPNRLGIGGWSNGGFMTEYAITRTTRFKAAVAQAAHADFFSLYGTSGGMRASHRVSTPDSPHFKRQWYDDHSPITLVRNCRTPTLLLHGERDSGVPVGQAYEFYTGLRDAGVETELVVYPREGHSIQEHLHRVDVQKRMLGWFDKHLK